MSKESDSRLAEIQRNAAQNCGQEDGAIVEMIAALRGSSLGRSGDEPPKNVPHDLMFK